MRTSLAPIWALVERHIIPVILFISVGIPLLLALLGIAMPLKYLAGLPQAVRVVGMVHGILFIILLVAIAHAQFTVRWPLPKVLGLVVAAVIPLGPFVAERWLRREQEAAVVREVRPAA